MDNDSPEMGHGATAGMTRGDAEPDSTSQTPRGVAQPDGQAPGLDGLRPGAANGSPYDPAGETESAAVVEEPPPPEDRDSTLDDLGLPVATPPVPAGFNDEILQVAARRDEPAARETRARALLRIDDRVGRILLSAVLAILMWFYVVNLENPTESSQFSDLSVDVHALGANVKATLDPSTVDATVQAPQNVLSTLGKADIKAFVDLTGLGAGVHTLPVRAEVLNARPSDVTIRFNPPNVKVQLDLQATRVLSVTAQIQGTPAFGYGMESPQITPLQVKVSGDQESVNRVTSVVVRVELDGKAGTQQGSKAPVALASNGDQITDLTFDPPTVDVVVPVKLLLNYKAVPVRAPLVGQPAPGYRVASIAVDPTNVTVCCLPTLLEPLQFVSAEPVAITGTTSPIITNTKLILPRGVELYPGQPAQITVTVNVEVLETTFQVSVAPSVEGLPSGWNAIISPDKIDLTLAGTFQQVQALSPTDVRAVVSLQGKTAGTFSTRPQIIVPQGVKLESSTPETVTVTLVAPTPAPTQTPTALPAPSATPTLESISTPASPTATPSAAPSATALPHTPTATDTPAAGTPEPRVQSSQPSPTSQAAEPSPSTGTGLADGP